MQPAKKRVAFSGVAAVLMAAVALVHAAPVAAAVGLPMVATDPTCAGKPVNSACGGRAQTGQVYKTPADTDLVRVRSDGATVADWESSAYVWELWRNVAPGRFYDACDSDVPAGSPVANGSCQAWSMRARAAPAIQFSASPLSGRAPLAVTVTWSVTDGTQCKAGGGWQGDKASAGTETITLVASASLALTCTVPGPAGPGRVVLTWTKPTQNTDGTPYTNAKGFYTWRGSPPPPTQRGPLLGPNVTSQTITDIPAGSNQAFGVTAVNADNVESDMPVVSQVIAGTPTTQSVSATPIAIDIAEALKKPRAPTLTIAVE